jgi:hypothetical protein
VGLFEQRLIDEIEQAGPGALPGFDDQFHQDGGLVVHVDVEVVAVRLDHWDSSFGQRV